MVILTHVGPGSREGGIVPSSDVTLHTLRHTAVSRMIAEGHNDHTVMAISGHGPECPSTR